MKQEIYITIIILLIYIVCHIYVDKCITHIVIYNKIYLS